MSKDIIHSSPPAAAVENFGLETPEDVIRLLQSQNYIAEHSLATALLLALRLRRPLFLEGEPGIGKTELAKAIASSLGRELLRVQCYEGLDVATSVYEWNYPRQMVAIRLAEAAGNRDVDSLIGSVFDQSFLIKRPLLQSLDGGKHGAPVLLIDELDRADEPFEAYLLELLSEFQVTVPEIGVFTAEKRPIVIITSNRTREVHDALRRRCFYHWIDYPNAALELKILKARVPGLPDQVSRELVSFVQILRKQDLFKAPGVAETLDFAAALLELNRVALDPATLRSMLGTLLKYQDDLSKVQSVNLEEWLEDARISAGPKEV